MSGGVIIGNPKEEDDRVEFLLTPFCSQKILPKSVLTMDCGLFCFTLSVTWMKTAVLAMPV